LDLLYGLEVVHEAERSDHQSCAVGIGSQRDNDIARLPVVAFYPGKWSRYSDVETIRNMNYGSCKTNAVVTGGIQPPVVWRLYRASTTLSPSASLFFNCNQRWNKESAKAYGIITTANLRPYRPAASVANGHGDTRP